MNQSVDQVKLRQVTRTYKCYLLLSTGGLEELFTKTSTYADKDFSELGNQLSGRTKANIFIVIFWIPMLQI